MDDSGGKSAKKGSKLSRTWNKFRHKIKSPKEGEEAAARHATPAYRPQSSHAAPAPAGTTARTSPTRKTPSSAPAPARKPAHAADAPAVFEKVSDLCPALQQLDQDLVGVSEVLLEFDRLHERVSDMHKRLASVPWQEFAVAESGMGDASAEEVAWEQVLPHLLEAMESVADAEAADAEFDSPALDASLEAARRALDAAAPGLGLAPAAAADAWSELDERCCAARLSRRSSAERGAWAATGGERGFSALASLAGKIPAELFVAAGAEGGGGELLSAEALPPALLAALAACELDLAALAVEGARSPAAAAAALGQALARVADAAEASGPASPEAAWALLELAAALSWRAFAQCRQARALARAHAAMLACLNRPGRLALRRVADREWRRRLGQILRQRALKIAAMLKAEMRKEVAALASGGDVPEPAGEWDRDSTHFPSASYAMQELEEAVTTSLFVPGHSCCPELLLTYALDLCQSYASFLVACVRPLLEGAAGHGPALEERSRRALALLAVALVQAMVSVPVPQLLRPVCDSAQLEWVAQVLESVVVAVARELGLELSHEGGTA